MRDESYFHVSEYEFRLKTINLKYIYILSDVMQEALERDIILSQIKEIFINHILINNV